MDWFNAVDLTYRADLREPNELNFARFDAKLEQRLAELREEPRQEIAELRLEFRTELQAVPGEIQDLRTDWSGSARSSSAGCSAAGSPPPSSASPDC